ncbi:MAG: hypothetical protein DHS20C16_07960 [Phycisphaerae bacterium]|nr:MAG: hypothetical protein DHS20C16_07960 [Phycisphaerae bacterium]
MVFGRASTPCGYAQIPVLEEEIQTMICNSHTNPEILGRLIEIRKRMDQLHDPQSNRNRREQVEEPFEPWQPHDAFTTFE